MLSFSLLIILKTLSTAIGDKVYELADTTLLDKQVVTQSIKLSLSLKSTGFYIVYNIFNDSSKAI